jgi:aminoglycoside 3-N-acetyltransferase
MLSYEDLTSGLDKLGLKNNPVIAHASLKSFGMIDGGASTLLRAILDSVDALVMPTFTYKTMITPASGPPNNGLTYGSDQNSNALAETFAADLPCDPMMGIVPETLRLHPASKRTSHPIQSFAGIHADNFLAAQTLQNPLGVIGALAESDGWVLLLGVDHTVNTSIHFAEKLAGRRQFVRWALTPTRIVECPGFPGDSAGFDALASDLENNVRRIQIGNATVQAIPLKLLFLAVLVRIKEDPLALLCQRVDCERCNAVHAYHAK